MRVGKIFVLVQMKSDLSSDFVASFTGDGSLKMVENSWVVGDTILLLKKFY